MCYPVTWVTISTHILGLLKQLNAVSEIQSFCHLLVTPLDSTQDFDEMYYCSIGFHSPYRPLIAR